MLSVIVLGSAAGGGVPQWNCACAVCRAAWADPSLRSGQASLAVSGDGGERWFLINASPDLRQQILDTPALHPRGPALRHSPIAGVVLTNGEIDAVAGLLSLREGWPLAIYGHQRVLDTLADNSLFNVLPPDRVPRRPMAVGAPFAACAADGAPSGLVIEAFAVPGKPAWYLEGTAAGAEADEGDTVALAIRDADGSREIIVVTACAGMSPELEARLRGADVVFFDGTLWTDDEMIRAGLSQKTGQRMGHLPMSGADGTIALLDGLEIRRKVFLHINNSNPVLLPGSPERAEVERAGWTVARPGMEVCP
jgi:pyrroloquinoline quinone biosynthesis protein B